MTERERFVRQWFPVAKQLTAGTGIFPEVMISQAIVESSAFNGREWVPGYSQLSRVANNFFGIKASSGWTGPTIQFKTGEVYNGKPTTVVGTFRCYNSPADSFRDYVKFLKENPRYTTAGVFTAATPKEQAEALQRAGYATDPMYSRLITSIVDQMKNWIKNLPAAGSGLIVAALVFFLIYKTIKK